jgi:hypothetical protein
VSLVLEFIEEVGGFFPQIQSYVMIAVGEAQRKSVSDVGQLRHVQSLQLVSNWNCAKSSCSADIGPIVPSMPLAHCEHLVCRYLITNRKILLFERLKRVLCANTKGRLAGAAPWFRTGTEVGGMIVIPQCGSSAPTLWQTSAMFKAPVVGRVNKVAAAFQDSRDRENCLAMSADGQFSHDGIVHISLGGATVAAGSHCLSPCRRGSSWSCSLLERRRCASAVAGLQRTFPRPPTKGRARSDRRVKVRRNMASRSTTGAKRGPARYGWARVVARGCPKRCIWGELCLARAV